MDVAHIMERRIYLDPGPEVGQSSSDVHNQLRRASDLIGADPFESEGVDVIGVETRAVKWTARQEAPYFDGSTTIPGLASSGVDSSISKPQDSLGSRVSQPQKSLQAEGTSSAARFSSVDAEDVVAPQLEVEGPKTLIRPPTITNYQLQQGVRHPSPRDITSSSHNNLHSESAYSLNTSAISQSYFTADNRSATPASPSHSFHASTPFSRSDTSDRNQSNVGQLSPTIFDMRTPPRFKPVSETSGGSHFHFVKAPPPLPPLDHPAFREEISEFGVVPSRGIPFPSRNRSNSSSKVARHSSSLPTIAQPRKVTRSETFFGSLAKRTRARARSSAAVTPVSYQRANPPSLEAAKKTFHSRSQSKSSITSSRRSSAEYSAQQATSGNNRGCWEVDVSKAIIGLAFGGGQVAKVKTSASTPVMTAPSTEEPAIQSMARGYNRPSGEGVVLGSPFFLQDPFTYNFIDKRISNDHHTSAKEDKSRYPVIIPTSKKKVNKSPDNEFDDIMTFPEESVTPITGSSTHPTTPDKGKESSSGGATPSPKSTSSRREGGRSETSHSRSRPPSPPPKKRIDTAQIFGSIEGSASLLSPPVLSITAPTPDASPISASTPTKRMHHKSTPTAPSRSILPPVIEKAHSSSSTKRKADEAGVGGDKTPPKENKEHRTTFAPEPRGHRASAASTSSHAPSSFNRSKRVRLTNASEASGGSTLPRSGSKAGTLPIDDSPPNAKFTGSWSSRGSRGPMTASSHGHAFHDRDAPPISPSASHGGRAPSRRSLSGASIPISALVSPHAPSVAHSGTFHMRDPRRPAPVQSTPWTLSLPTHVQPGESRWALNAWVARGGSPLHAWCFFIGFVLFPLWWVAAIIPIPRTRRLGGTDAEKGVILDDPQVEHDANSWRFRCRVMAGVSILTYIPFIVLVAIFAR